jgi:DNA-binding CsgD family transcriptional regulator
LQSLLSQARRGSGRVVFVEGPAGVGKTRLLESLRTPASEASIRTLSARATELERDFPYGVVRQLFGPLIASATDAERAVLSEGAASAANLVLGLDVDRPDSSASGDPSFSTLNGLYWLAFNLTRAGPVVLAIDDSQWCDTPSLQFLSFLVPRLEELPVLLALTARLPEAEQQSLLTGLRADPSAHRISPGPLGRDSVATLLADALGSTPEAPFTAACVAQTGGNPFLLSELTRTLVGDGVQPSADNAHVVTELAPDAIVQSVLLRLDPLHPDAKQLAQAVAILGDGCEPRDVATLAQLDATGAAMAEASDDLRKAGILDPGTTLQFLHPLIRTALYSDISAGARSHQHRRAAALLTKRGAPAERIAIHLLAIDPAGNEQIARTLFEAAQAAFDQGAPHPAFTYLARALREPAPPDLRIDVLRLLILSADRSADIALALEFEDDALEALAADADGLADVIGIIARGLAVTGRPDEAREVYENAIDSAERSGDLARAVALEAQMAFFLQGGPAEARERFRRYDGRLAKGSPEERLALTLNAWWGRFFGDRATVVADRARRALADGKIFDEQAGSPSPRSTVITLASTDELDAAKLAADQLVAHATSHGDAVALATGWCARGITEHRRGRLRFAAADARQATELAQLRGFFLMLPLLSAFLITASTDLGELDYAEQILERTFMAGEIPQHSWFDATLYGRGILRLAQGRNREAANDLVELGERVEKWGFAAFIGRPAAQAAVALNALGETDRALALAEEDLAEARRWAAPSAVVESLTALGRVAEGQRRLELLQEAVDIAETTPAKLPQTAALLELGAAHRERGGEDRARPLLRSALDMARRSGAALLARRAAGELEALGEKVPHYTPIGVDALTPSERRVADMASSGLMNREIAAELYITVKTVESHLRATYDKLGIESRRDLEQALSEG